MVALFPILNFKAVVPQGNLPACAWRGSVISRNRGHCVRVILFHCNGLEVYVTLETRCHNRLCKE